MAHRRDTIINDVSQLTPRKPPPLPPPPLRLRGMEIGISPGSYPATPQEDSNPTTRRNQLHHGDLNLEEYRRVAELYANRPLPPLPLSKISRQRRPAQTAPPIDIARKPVNTTLRAASPEMTRQIVMKPLPPPPMCEPPNNIPLSRRMSRSCPPTGHQPSQKVQQLMGCDIDIYDDTRAPYASMDSRFLEEDLSSEYSMEADHVFDRSVSPMSYTQSSSRRVRFSDTGPLTPPSQHSQLPLRPGSYEYRLEKPIRSAYERFSDHKASSEYHKFTQELACDAGLAGDRPASGSSKGGASRPLMRRRGAGYQVSPRSTLETADQRPSSCFEHDDDEDDDTGLLSAEVATKLMGSMKGFIKKTREKHSTRAAKAVERAERHREEDFKRSFKVVEGSGRRL